MDLLSFFRHPLIGSPASNLVKLYLHRGVTPKKWAKASYLLLNSLLYSAPKMLEKIKYEKRFAATSVKSPVFILGHWRSGTTYLHYLLNEDPQFATCTWLECMFPYESVVCRGFLRPLLKSLMPTQRGFDNVALDLDLPCEDEFALACMGEQSFIHELYYFLNADAAWIDFDLNSADIEKNLSYFLKKIQFLHPANSLLIKNPGHTGRVAMLLKLFPDAKFIHIYRNPYNVFSSFVKMLKGGSWMSFQKPPSEEELENFTFSIYRKQMTSFFEQKDKIPKGNLYELKYEDFERKPLEEVGKIYTGLNLCGYHEAESKFQALIEKEKSYQKNVHLPLTEEKRSRIYKQMQQTIDLWGYKAP